MSWLPNMSAEERSLMCFDDFEKENYPLRLAYYKDNKYFYKGKFSALTNGIGETRFFRAYLNEFIKNYKPELFNIENDLWLSLKDNGEFVVIKGGQGKVISDLSKEDLFRYNLLCYINLIRFWDEFNQIRNINTEKMPVVIKLPDNCDFDVNCPHIVFPRTMTAISDKMYEYLCLTDEIERIEVEEGNPVFRSVNNCLIESATGTLIMGCKNSIIPDDNTIKKIGKMAFDGCLALKEIKIPQGVTEIGYMAFAFTSIEEIVIPESVTEISPLCFVLNPQLKTVIINGKNTKIGKMAFATKGEVKKHNRPTLIPESKANNIKIIAPNNSTAYEYAKEYEIEFEELK